MTVRILAGHVLDKLADLEDESCHMVLTSPPYYGLRAYGTEPQVWGGDGSCEHDWQETFAKGQTGGDGKTSGLNCRRADDGSFHKDNKSTIFTDARLVSAFCLRCHAWRGELGQEPTVAMYIDHLVAVFAAVKRVLRRDGILVVNLGDSYFSDNRVWSGRKESLSDTGMKRPRLNETASAGARHRPSQPGLKPKDLMLVPDRFRIAMQEDGWYVRSKMVWAKRSAMPESVTDRPTTSLEDVIMFTKTAKYFWDPIAVARQGAPTKDGIWLDSRKQDVQPVRNGQAAGSVLPRPESEGRVPCRLQGVRVGIEADTGRAGAGTGIHPLGSGEGGEQEALREEARSLLGKASSLSSDGTVEGAAAPVLGDGAGQGRASTPEPEAARGAHRGKDGPELAHLGAMGANQGALWAPMRLLPESDATADAGSRHPVKPGRNLHNGQHHPGLPVVQLSEEHQSRVGVDGGESDGLAHARNEDRGTAGASRNLRNGDFLFDSLGLILDEDGDPLALDVNPAGFKEAHFATFPPKLVRPLIQAGSSERGCCPNCLAPSVRQVNVGYDNPGNRTTNGPRSLENRAQTAGFPVRLEKRSETTGWSPSCQCPDPGPPIPCTVLDPFSGAGTTLLVSDQLGRDAIGIDLQPSYAEMALSRVRDDCPMFADVEVR